MLIGEAMERTPDVTAAENMANRLADRIRNSWLSHKAAGEEQWEDNFYEDPDGIAFLRGEAFPHLQGIDYQFQWWGAREIDGLAGNLVVLWKARRNNAMEIYKTTIRFADRDFTVPGISKEHDKRELTRAEFRRAFSLWQKLYLEHMDTTDKC